MFNYIETYTIITRTFIYLKGKKIVFLFIYRNWTIWQYSITLFEIIIKFYSRRFNFFSTFWTNFKFSAICVSSVIAILSTITFLGKFWLLHLPLQIETLIISITFLILFLRVSINLKKWFFLECFLIASNNFLQLLYSVSLSSFLFLTNLL